MTAVMRLSDERVTIRNELLDSSSDRHLDDGGRSTV
jgi:hypothetical protein